MFGLKGLILYLPLLQIPLTSEIPAGRLSGFTETGGTGIEAGREKGLQVAEGGLDHLGIDLQGGDHALRGDGLTHLMGQRGTETGRGHGTGTETWGGRGATEIGRRRRAEGAYLQLWRTCSVVSCSQLK